MALPSGGSVHYHTYLLAPRRAHSVFSQPPRSVVVFITFSLFDYILSDRFRLLSRVSFRVSSRFVHYVTLGLLRSTTKQDICSTVQVTFLNFFPSTLKKKKITSFHYRKAHPTTCWCTFYRHTNLIKILLLTFQLNLHFNIFNNS